jgi:acetylornithine deacetylase/succinyl-diaminopimelate desuccinylase family protein
MTNDVISLLAELVKIPSACGEEQRIASFIYEWLRRNGLPADLVPVEPHRPNVVVTLGGAQPGPSIMLNGHMDTVPVGRGWKHSPFGAEIEGGRMYGRGTIDMKAGLASILWAVVECHRQGLPKRGQLTLAAVVDEEAIDLGTYTLIQKGYARGVDFAMIPEATDLQIVTAHRGRVVIEVEVHGRATHSYWPEHGVNAIDKTVILLDRLPKFPTPKHPRLGESTLNTLKIEGGQEQVMLVPDRCRIVIDRCLVPGYTSRQALADIVALIRHLQIQADAKLVDRKTPFCEPFEIPDDSPPVQMVMNVASRVLGTKRRIGFHLGPCDSCILVSEAKVPTIEFGPIGGGLNESDEYVEIASVRRTAEVYAELIKSALGKF